MNKTLLSVFAGLALGGRVALAQTGPPVLSAPPVAPAPAAPAPAAPSADPFLLGRTYRVETVQGTTFTGQLVSMSLTAVEFDAKELGHLNLERSQIRRAELQGPLSATTKAGYYDIGNGNRLFFAPTGRGLRKGENTLQVVSLYFVGGNFGLTDNVSLGGYVSVIPGIGLSNQFLMLTPKVSFPVSEKLHLGAGALYLRIPDFNGSLDKAYGAGILYGAATYGSADNNVTAGLGYGFFEGEIGSTPILQLGGQKRVSRRISLVSENYIILDSKAGMGGLYGVKINWRRTSLGLGAAYLYTFPYEETQTSTYYDYNTGQTYTSTYRNQRGGDAISTYIIPVYIDFTFRFGKGVK
ncbi:MAG: hypothetical protein M3Y12_03220 [Bacteroidota bacterium]|nr:hypothetical protein [Bacteroidota bacterium]